MHERDLHIDVFCPLDQQIEPAQGTERGGGNCCTPTDRGLTALRTDGDIVARKGEPPSRSSWVFAF